MPDSSAPNLARRRAWLDGNEAAAYSAYLTNEIIAIYPITPSTPMGEIADAQASAARPNLWGMVPDVVEMQSEAGVAGALHGALTTGALCTTFTASQGLLLMIPNMYKLAGELTPTVFHVAARAIATSGLSIFGDHSDVMAARGTGWGMLCSNSPQESMDMALIAQAATLRTRLPLMHFFDGFRTSHEITDLETLSTDDMLALLPPELMAAHRARGLTPQQPAIRGTAHNPDTFFQAREAANLYYQAAPKLVQEAMEELGARTGRHYRLFDYFGHPEAERVIVAMGSAVPTAQSVALALNATGQKTGVLAVRLYRPLDTLALARALPPSVRRLAVLDRCKEPGAAGEPLYLDVVAGLREQGRDIPVTGGRYGLGSKEFDAAMAKAVFDDLDAATPRNHFTVGIEEDVTHSSLRVEADYSCESEEVQTALFYGLGSDGTVGANKNSIKIIGEATGQHVQAYFVYDSKKAGSMTTSHLRFSRKPIQASYLIRQADFVACHAFQFLERYEILDQLKLGGTFLLNSPYAADRVWDHLPREVQEQLLEKQAKFYCIDAYGLARQLGLGGRINVLMQTAFFCIAGVVEQDRALPMIENAIRKTYGSKGTAVVDMNLNAVKLAVDSIGQVALPATAEGDCPLRSWTPENAPTFVRDVTAPLMAGHGDRLPVSAFPADGTWPLGTTRYEKRRIATTIPVWDPELCIQCNLCAFNCPHATIRAKAIAPDAPNHAPATFETVALKGKGGEGYRFRIQVAPEDCTGCAACVETCPAFEKDASGQKTGRRAINMEPVEEHLEREAENWKYFLELPDTEPPNNKRFTAKGSQFRPPLFEFSGACAGCGETPYVKLLTQLYGERLMIANATGCSSIYGGNLPTTPYCTNADGHGPGWSNSLFEDAAEFGLGMRLTHDQLNAEALRLLAETEHAQATPIRERLEALDPLDDAQLEEIRELVGALKQSLEGNDDPVARRLLGLADHLCPQVHWIVGGDGWAYDIGFGGLDHVLASGRNVNILVMDTGVYSNTGGQASKATPKGAIAKFASNGKGTKAKDLGALARSYGSVYVAQIAFGASSPQTVNALKQAAAYHGPSLVIAYAHCIAHGINMTKGSELQKLATESGFWPLYRYQPATGTDEAVFKLDSRAPKEDVEKFMFSQNRFKLLRRSDPKRAERLLASAREDVAERWEQLQELAKR
ncbi:MAG: pyruvate:ferredoxin (flavodoxin) oxidoreductase [Verrucomicrobiota bacterium]